MSSNEKKLFGKRFIVKDNDLYIRYLGIGSLNKEKSVYLRAGLNSDVIGMGYGKKYCMTVDGANGDCKKCWNMPVE